MLKLRTIRGTKFTSLGAVSNSINTPETLTKETEAAPLTRVIITLNVFICLPKHKNYNLTKIKMYDAKFFQTAKVYDLTLINLNFKNYGALMCIILQCWDMLRSISQ